MAKKWNDQASPLLSKSCAAKWPKEGFKILRHHVEIAEFSKASLEAHLEECIPGDKRERKRALEEALSVIRIWRIHPDVAAKKRKASEIWLAARGVITLAPLADGWETKRECRLTEMYEAELRKGRWRAGEAAAERS